MGMEGNCEGGVPETQPPRLCFPGCSFHCGETFFKRRGNAFLKNTHSEASSLPPFPTPPLPQLPGVEIPALAQGPAPVTFQTERREVGKQPQPSKELTQDLLALPLGGVNAEWAAYAHLPWKTTITQVLQ